MQGALNNAIGYLRYLLAKTTTLRYVPRLEFIYDQSIARANRISLLIKYSLENDRDDRDA